jgi:D-alanyl-D-alanine carboxypeptidase (penicillin-binding protein 5/6)
VDDAPARTRRERRARRHAPSATPADAAAPGGVLTVPDANAAAPHPVSSTAADAAPAAESTVAAVPVAAAAAAVTIPSGSRAIDVVSPPSALAWVDERTITRMPAPGDLSAAASPYVPVETDLLADAPRRPLLRAGVIAPLAVVVGLLGAYSGTTLLWPLHAVTPTVSAVQVQPVAAPAAALTWPATGSAAVAVGGFAGSVASSADPHAIASITKVVTALVVLEEMPLAPGEQGPEFRFSAADRTRYWQYRSNGESALDVPVGGVLTQYQMLEGMLIGSANNYADRLAQNLWPSDAVFASAARAWLESHGVPGVTVVEPTGMDAGNSASPDALITLAQKALANPVIAEIVAKASVELPGAGLVENTNALLADPGVVGIKTGTLDTWNLLSAKDVVVGDTTVRLFASVLGQPDDTARLAASRDLYAQVEQDLQPEPSVTAGSVAGYVETRWGEKVEIVTAGDASVVLWNGRAGTVTSEYDLADKRDAGDTVGELSVAGPVDTDTVDLRLAEDVADPSPWWRLTHPLDLFGLND